MAAQSEVLSQLLEKETGLAPREVRGAALCTFAIGGRLARLVEFENLEQAVALRSFLARHEQRQYLLGAGSNLLIADQGLDDWVLKAGRGLRYFERVSDLSFRVGTAMPLMMLSQELCALGLGGLEFAGGIPGSMGGALRMNAGAHGGQISDIVSEVRCVSEQGELLSFRKDELDWSYRHCSLPQGMLVVEVRLALRQSSVAECLENRNRCLMERKARQPLSSPSAGSVFRNPSPEKPAGLLIEQAGLKGERRGGARISELHANWIINDSKKASAGDVEELIELCRSRVREQSGIELQTEIVRWG